MKFIKQRYFHFKVLKIFSINITSRLVIIAKFTIIFSITISTMFTTVENELIRREKYAFKKKIFLSSNIYNLYFHSH